ncbi:hypothetical protein B9Z55_020825 [Caenorhabditis nigoni]|uniref:F-box domain-containing protein n=1 Tax=Caenorhabditis nigoni TaxID=1611254 RepID=A0A2G5TPA9_9PELO|nr:hypothetical protein B9Z55_020825 [Caenorhabditis nigoni]
MNCFFDIFRCNSKKRFVIISPSPINLIDLPELVLETILENLDFHSILILRRVCRSLRDFIDDIKPPSHLTTILIHVQSKLVSVELHFPSGPKSFNGYQTLYIDFHKTKNGCRLEYYKGMRYKVNRVKKFLENEDFVKTAMNDLKVLMNHQKTVLETFRLDIDYYNNTANDFDRNMEPIAQEVLGGFKEILEPRRSPIQLKNFQMTIVRQDQVAQILPFVDSKVLQKIGIRGKKEHPMDSFRIDELEK